jgi:triacylglycerol lipase
VAHSMGGLAVRRWLVEQSANAKRVAEVITLGTPHHGTWLGRYALSNNARQMRLASPWQKALQQRELGEQGAAVRFTCFYSHCDNIVFPASTATLAGANNQHLRGVAHVRMVDHPEPFAALREALSR